MGLSHLRLISMLQTFCTIPKNFPSRQEAETELIRQNHENKLEIKNIMQDCGNYYAVKLPNSKEFLVNKINLHFY